MYSRKQKFDTHEAAINAAKEYSKNDGCRIYIFFAGKDWRVKPYFDQTWKSWEYIEFDNGMWSHLRHNI